MSDPQESGFSSPAADRYKLSVREFNAQLAGLMRSDLFSQYTGLSRRSGEAAKAELTFDDGGESFYTIVADKLEARGLLASCFVTTDYIGRLGFLSAAQIRELARRGHVMGSHSVSHPARFSLLSRPAMTREWTESRKTLEDILGCSVTTGSVPGGYFSREVGVVAAECGLNLLFNSEPVCAEYSAGTCTIAGRFTIRSGAAADLSQKLVERAPWTRSREWATWNAKSLVKPLLGSSYPRVADWIHGGAR